MDNGRQIEFVKSAETAVVEKSAEAEKTAKETAVDKATSIAESLGKPTGAGLAAGAGLGTILAAISKFKKDTDPSSKDTLMGNPLLMGALGAAGGYLAGNAFDNIPSKPIGDRSSGALPWLAGTGGLYGLGSSVSDALAETDLEDTMKKFRDKNWILPRRTTIKLPDGTRQTLRQDTYQAPNSAAPERGEFDALARKRIRALKRKGDFDGAKVLERIIDSGNKNGKPGKLDFMEPVLKHVRHSKWSPVAHIKDAPRSLETLSRLLLKEPITNVRAGIARAGALAALAGGGKLTYDFFKD